MTAKMKRRDFITLLESRRFDPRLA